MISKTVDIFSRNNGSPDSSSEEGLKYFFFQAYACSIDQKREASVIEERTQPKCIQSSQYLKLQYDEYFMDN